MSTHAAVGRPAISWRKLMILLGLGVVLYILLPQLGNLDYSLSVLGDIQMSWLAVALLWSALSYPAAALVYMNLARRSLRLGPTSLVELAGNFANRLVPAGIGAIATNYRYLRRSKHTEAQAEVIVTLNNAIGLLGNMLLLVAFVLTTGTRPKGLHVASGVLLLVLGVVAVAVILLIILFGRTLQRKLVVFARALLAYRRRPWRLVAALLASVGLTLCYSLCLLACVRAVGLTIGLPALFISMSLGVAGATITPTPGGLGGAEAALFAALAVYGAVRPQALAAVLLYRLLTFWLPLVFGGLALAYAHHRKYL